MKYRSITQPKVIPTRYNTIPLPDRIDYWAYFHYELVPKPCVYHRGMVWIPMVIVDNRRRLLLLPTIDRQQCLSISIAARKLVMGVFP